MDDETGIPASSPRRAAKLERRLARNCADTLTRGIHYFWTTSGLAKTPLFLHLLNMPRLRVIVLA
jgi:hypothetical protein